MALSAPLNQILKISVIGYLTPFCSLHVLGVHYRKQNGVICSSNSNFTVPNFEIGIV